MSRRSRLTKKLLSKTTWHRKTGSTREENSRNTNRKGAGPTSEQGAEELIPQTVLFVEYSRGGELASRLRELFKRLEKVVGFSVKVVERAGTTLKNMFSTTTLWDGSKCGREECTTCNQGAEMPLNCRKASLVYENVCRKCNPGAGADKEMEEVKDDTPTLYVSESSRSVFERSREHWGAWRNNKEDSHMLRHQRAEHGGGDPDFIMRVVRHFKSALSRQVGEAVRIRRRGGAGKILNSKAEYNRCRIPRLVIEEQDEELMREEEEKEIREAVEQLEEQEKAWGSTRIRAREQELGSTKSRLGKITGKVGSQKRE